MNIINSFRAEYFFLSNFYPREVTHKKISYPTTEHAFQAEKSDDENVKIRISKLLKPGDAKSEGQKIRLRSDWEQVKLKVMEDILFDKFVQNPDLKKRLIDTEDASLIEGNTWHDNFWGDCYCNKCIGIPGQNNLGKILMKVRENLIKTRRL
jgi:ribA/ribD-fused uncharacterized protein